jgi:DNA-binding SARP family transcriptional activator
MSIVNEVASNPHQLEINLFGGLSIKVDGMLCNINVKRSKQVLMLAGYIFANRFSVNSIEQYANILWGDSGEGKEADNPQGALKNLVWRCRKILRDALPSEFADDLVIFTGNTYTFNNALSCTIDIEELEKLYKGLYAKINSTDHILCLEKIVALYRGDFLPIFSDKDWVVVRSTYFKRIYIKCVNDLLSMYLENELFDKVIVLCETALKYEQYDESMHIAYIKALTAISRIDRAVAHYEHVGKIFYRDLGIAASSELRGLYNEIQKVDKSEEAGINQIMNEMDEATQESGCYFCNYEIFKNIYRLQCRSAKRNKQNVSIMLVTMNGNLTMKNSTAHMELLKQCISTCLRSADVFTRYSINQFLISLPNVTKSNTNKIIKRISDSFNPNCRKYNMSLSFTTVEKDVKKHAPMIPPSSVPLSIFLLELTYQLLMTSAL